MEQKYVINLNHKKSGGSHWVSFIDIHLTVYKMMILLCVDFTVSLPYMIAGTTLLDYTNLFSSNDYKKNDKVIYKYFKDKYGKRKCKMKSFLT